MRSDLVCVARQVAQRLIESFAAVDVIQLELFAWLCHVAEGPGAVNSDKASEERERGIGLATCRRHS